MDNQTREIRSNILYGKTVYSCVAGYEAVGGVSVIECQITSQWSIPSLQCGGNKPF